MNYKDKLKLAKEALESGSYDEKTIKYIFPELIESEDEKIRRDLLHFLNAYIGCSIAPTFCTQDIIKWIAYLEKQGQVKESLIYQHENKMCKENDDSLTSEDERIRESIIKIINRYVYNSNTLKPKMLAWIEKQGEQEPAEYTLEQAANIFLGALSNTPYNNKPITDAQVITKELLKFLSNAHSYNPNAINEQKPADKVEPKFHEGDWVVSPNGVYWHIDAIQNGRYEVTADTGQCGNWPLDTNLYRLWTIQDAKDGDVLYECNEKKPFIFKELETKHIGDIASYCDIFNGIFNPNEDNWTTLDIVPATKEQRDLLFKKMKEAGYEWDDEKKELKKIEQKPAELPKGEDYGIDGLYAAIDILQNTLGKVDGYQSDDGILEHKCAIEAVNRLYKQKPAWSEEEHCIINGIIGYLCTHDSCELEGFDKWYDFLKSLKYRCLPQQQEWNEEDKRILSGLSGLVKDCYLNGGYALPTDEYDEYKKWLKSLKDRCLPQPKQEWSEEDEKMLSNIEDCIKNLPIFYESININGEDKTTERFVYDAINWFKCLKERYTWKPSDEQVKALLWVIENTTKSKDVNILLNSLYEDLKAL